MNPTREGPREAPVGPDPQGGPRAPGQAGVRGPGERAVPPAEPPSPDFPAEGGDDPLLGPIGRYLADLEIGASPPLDLFLEQLPPELRERARGEIEDLLAVGRVLRRQRPPAEDPLTIVGTRVSGHHVLRLIGQGAAGCVYLARDPAGREVALKVLHPHLCGDERVRERFRREPLAVRDLDHPNIVRVLDAGEDAGLVWFSMEHVPGGTLADRLRALRAEGRRTADRRAGKRAPPRLRRGWSTEVARLGAALAEALQAAHARGVLHRDVKPQNVLLDGHGEPHLSDFGLAKQLGAVSLSQAGDLAGTPHYMSPEQTLAKRVAVDHRTDVFSLGVILYELLTLERPFDGDSLDQVFYAISFTAPRAIRRLNPAVPRDLETICHKAIEKDRAERYATAGEMAADLRRFLTHESVVARPPGLGKRAARRLSVLRRELLVASAAVLLVAGGLAWKQHADRGSARARLLVELREEAAAQRFPEHPSEYATADVGGLATFSRRIAAALEDPGHGAEERRELERLRAAQEIEGRRILAEARELHRLGTWPAPGDPDPGRAQDDTAYVQALLLYQKAAQLVDVPPEELDLSRAWPRVRFAAPAHLDGARVAVREIDLVTQLPGPRRELGTLPLGDLPLPQGYYRFIVEQPGHGFAEMTRYLYRRGATLELPVWIRPTPEVVDGMAYIEPGELVFGMPDTDTPLFRERVMELDGFHASPYEATNAEYRRFLEATGHPEPHHWEEARGAFDAATWDELPISNVPHGELTLFAEWMGARLPTVFEWERLARHTDGRRLPFGDDVPPEERLTRPIRPLSELPWIEDRWAREYAAGVVPVREFPAGSQAESGAVHLVDNVSEWTETMYVGYEGGWPHPQPFDRLDKGWSYNEMRNVDISMLEEYGVTPHGRAPAPTISVRRGVRLFKSASP